MAQLLSQNNKIIPENNLKINISGDGTKVGKWLRVINVAFNIVNDDISNQTCYPLCIVQTKEKYADLKAALSDLQRDVSELQGSVLTVGDR